MPMIYKALFHVLFGPYKRPLKKDLINKLCNIHAMEYFATIKTGSIHFITEIMVQMLAKFPG